MEGWELSQLKSLSNILNLLMSLDVNAHHEESDLGNRSTTSFTYEQMSRFGCIPRYLKAGKGGGVRIYKKGDLDNTGQWLYSQSWGRSLR